MVFAVAQIAFYYALKWTLGSLDPSQSRRKKNTVLPEFVVERLRERDHGLDEYEAIVGVCVCATLCMCMCVCVCVCVCVCGLE